MDYGTENIGTGAYTAGRDIGVVSQDGLYAATYELIRRHSRTKHVLDIGCSDGVGTYGLSPDFFALGIDFDAQSVRLANEIAAQRTASGQGPTYEAVEASLLDIPTTLAQRITSGSFDCVTALDVLEHFTRSDALQVMRSVGRLMLPEHTFIVSMPIISAFSMETYRELVRVARARQRPPSGLLDRTHLILRGKIAHRRLFREAGYHVVSEYQTDHVSGITGDWDWQTGGTMASQLEFEARRRAEENHRLARLLTQGYAAAQGTLATRKIAEALFAYQGVYALAPGSS